MGLGVAAGAGELGGGAVVGEGADTPAPTLDKESASLYEADSLPRRCLHSSKLLNSWPREIVYGRVFAWKVTVGSEPSSEATSSTGVPPISSSYIEVSRSIGENFRIETTIFAFIG